jgi:hypothetical protein
MTGDIIESKFDAGDQVLADDGAGVVCSVFKTPNGLLRYVVAHPVNAGYVLHIYSEANLRAAT